MEQQEPPPPTTTNTTTVAAAATTTTSSTTTSTASTPPPPTPPPPETHPPHPPPVSTTPPDISIQPPPNPNPNPNPSADPNPTPTDPPKPPQQIQQPQPQPQQILQPRQPPPPSPPPPSFSRPWQQPPPQPPQSAPALAPAHPPRGGIAIGVPTNHGAAAPSLPSSTPFPPSFNQQFGSNPRAPESISSPAASQLRAPSAQGMHGVGMIGSMGSASQMRPGAIPQQRSVQQPIRPLSSPINQATTSQSFQGQSLMRASSVGPPISATSNTQSLPSPNQPWLSSAPQGKPPLPPPSYRPQMSVPSLQQRPHIPQQQQQQQQQHQHHHQLPIASQNHSSAQQQPQTQPQPQPPSPSPQSQDHYSHQFPPRVPQPLQHQQIARVQASGNQKAPSVAITQEQSSNPVPPSKNNISAVAETDESGNRILTKRSINEVLNQIDPSEKLDPEVEDVLVDIAEEFVESITTFGCSLAKHRKSTVLEAKDILLHLERNWNMSLPGFGGDEIKSYRKPVSTDIHKERLSAIKKSLAAAEAAAYAKNVAGQTVGNTRGSLNKAPANVLGSPNMKN